MKKISLIIFLLATVSQFMGIWFSIPLLLQCSKPVIMLSLMAYYYVGAEQRSVLFLASMFFCWLGDVWLMFQPPIFFMLGLGSFLIGHVGYTLSYRQLMRETGTPLMGPQRVRFSLPIVLFGTGLVVVLYPVLGELKIPVMIYALVITVMTLTALFRFGLTSTKSFVFIFGGAILFMISDSILAINKFREPLPYASHYIMSTYMLAQYLIVKGALTHRA